MLKQNSSQGSGATQRASTQARRSPVAIRGRPFASARLIARLERKLRRHWMYSDQAAQNRLHMCDRCRVQDLFFTSRK